MLKKLFMNNIIIIMKSLINNYLTDENRSFLKLMIYFMYLFHFKNEWRQKNGLKYLFDSNSIMVRQPTFNDRIRIQDFIMKMVRDIFLSQLGLVEYSKSNSDLSVKILLGVDSILISCPKQFLLALNLL